MKARIFVASLCITALATAHAVEFNLTWSNVGPQPLSPLFWSVGDSSFDIFSLGGTSSSGIESIAETGNAAPMLAIAGAAGASLQGFGALTSGGPLLPGQTRTAVINMNPGSDYFSFATMLGMTNDGFLGESVSSMGLRLFNGTTPLGFSINVYGARAWDAGTEWNSQDAADLAALGGSGSPAEPSGLGFIRVHETIVPNRGDSFGLLPDWTTETRLMTLTLTPVPEPATIAALCAGFGLLLRRRSHR